MSESYRHGFLDRPSQLSLGSIVLTHGAGSNCNAPLLRRLAEQLADSGWTVYRFDLPFRRKRASGSPHPSTSALDRDGIRAAVADIRLDVPGPVILGGQSYGGRQATMAAAEDPKLSDALLLLSYPLHPPGKPAQLRTAHFPDVRTKAAFMHGSRDPFGSPEEMRLALKLIPAATTLQILEGAGHDLRRSAGRLEELVGETVRSLLA